MSRIDIIYFDISRGCFVGLIFYLGITSLPRQRYLWWPSASSPSDFLLQIFDIKLPTAKKNVVVRDHWLVDHTWSGNSLPSHIWLALGSGKVRIALSCVFLPIFLLQSVGSCFDWYYKYQPCTCMYVCTFITHPSPLLC